MLLKSFKLLAVLGLIFLFMMYFAMELRESLMDLVSEVIFLMELCREIG